MNDFAFRALINANSHYLVVFDSTMATQFIWFKLKTPQETTWTEVSLENVRHVDGLKKAIKDKKSVRLKDVDADELILKAKKKGESDEQAVELDDPEASITSVRQRFGPNFRVLASVPARE